MKPGSGCSSLGQSSEEPTKHSAPLAPSLAAVITDSLQGELEVVTEAGTGKAKDSDKVGMYPLFLLLKGGRKK